MWRRRRRLRQLEAEIAAAKAERADLRRRLDWFEAIAAAAGAPAPGTVPERTVPQRTVPQRPVPQRPVPQPAAAPVAPPPNLLAAARDLHRRDVPVRLDVDGAEVVAVVGGPGDPREWWTAIWLTTGPDAADREEAQA